MSDLKILYQLHIITDKNNYQLSCNVTFVLFFEYYTQTSQERDLF
jgi:hypothetical protein